MAFQNGAHRVFRLSPVRNRDEFETFPYQPDDGGKGVSGVDTRIMRSKQYQFVSRSVSYVAIALIAAYVTPAVRAGRCPGGCPKALEDVA